MLKLMPISLPSSTTHPLWINIISWRMKRKKKRRRNSLNQYLLKQLLPNNNLNRPTIKKARKIKANERQLTLLEST